MKKTATKLLLLVLVLALTIACFAACGKGGGQHVITIMDGEKVLATINVADSEKLSVETANLDKSGYELVGLFVDPEFTTRYVLDSEVVGDLTIYAQFRQRQLYISVYSQEGVSAVERVAVTKDASYSIGIPTKVGYTFTGYTYNDEERGEVAFPTSGDAYPFDTSIRLTAHWTETLYTVRLHVGETVTEQSVAHGKTATLTAPTKAGYTFGDWRLDGATAAFDATTPITSDLDLYARFTANSYLVSFDRALGLQSVTVTYDGDYSLTAPTQAGKRFEGFLYNGVAFPASGKYQIVGDVYLTGTWADLTYDVTFLTANDEELAKQTGLLYGAKAQAINVVGYTVQGYYLDKAFSEDKAVDLATYQVTASTTLYVKTEANEYTLTVEGWTSVKVRYGATYTLLDPSDTTNAEYVAKIGDGVDQPWSAFRGYTYKGQAFPSTGKYTWAENIIVTPDVDDNPHHIYAYVSFYDTIAKVNFSEDAVQVVKGATVAEGDFPSTEKVGYRFDGWYTTANFATGTEFNKGTAVGASVTVYAKYTAHTWTLTIKDTNAEGATLEVINVTYGQSFNLPGKAALEAKKRGYTFSAFSETLNTDAYLTDDNKTIYAVYTQNEVTVTFLPENFGVADKTLHQYDKLSAFLPATDPEKIGYTFKGWSLTNGGEKADYTQEVGESIAVYAIFEANAYKITLIYSNTKSEVIDVTYDADYALPENPVNVGSSFVRYTYGGNNFPRTGKYTIDDNIDVLIEWAVDSSLFVEKTDGLYFKERENAEAEYTYVFLTGIDYTFPGNTLSAAGASSYISMNGTNGFRAIAATPSLDVFDLTVTPDHGEQKTIKARVVENVNTIGFGENYHNMIDNATNGTLFVNAIDNEAAYKMDIGRTDYRPEITIKNLANKALTLEEANVEISLNGGAADYSLSGSSVTFNSVAYESAGTVTLTYKAKYALTAYNLTAPAQKVEMNGGVNVYTNSDLKVAYSNTSVTKINVLRNITAELNDNEYELSKGGHGKLIETVTLSENGNPKQITVDTGTPYNDFKHGVYNRSTNNASDNVVINGNYFSIDGSKLPYIDNMHDYYGAKGSEYAGGFGYRVANVQVGIFLYRCGQLDENDDLVKKYATGNATFNNLRINGNNIYDSTVTQDLGDSGEPLLKMSAAYIGMVVRGGTVNMNNTSIVDTSMAFMLHGSISGYKYPGLSDDSAVMNAVQPGETQATKLYANGMIMDNSWANSIYCFDLTYMQLLNSRIGKSCGLAIHCDDRPYGGNAEGSLGYSNLNCQLVLDRATANSLNNWVVGDEAWFVAYNMAGTATGEYGVKTLIHQGVISATGGLLGLVDTSSGYEKMNLAFLAKPVDLGSIAAWKADKDNYEPENPAEWLPTPHIDVTVLSASGLEFFYSNDDELVQIGAELLPELTGYTLALQQQDNDTATACYSYLTNINFTNDVGQADNTKKATFKALLDGYTGDLTDYATALAMQDQGAAATAYAAAMEKNLNMLLMYYQQKMIDFGVALTTYQLYASYGDMYPDEMQAALASAAESYTILMKVGRPYTSQTAAGMQIILPLYYATEVVFPA